MQGTYNDLLLRVQIGKLQRNGRVCGSMKTNVILLVFKPVRVNDLCSFFSPKYNTVLAVTAL